MAGFSVRRMIAWFTSERLVRDLRRRAEWIDQVRSTPTLHSWWDAWVAGRADDPISRTRR